MEYKAPAVRRLLTLTLGLVSLAATRRAEAEPHLFEVGPSVSWSKRTTTDGPVTYEAGMGQGAYLKAGVHRYVGVSLRYQRAFHDVTIDAGNTPAPGKTYSLDALRIETLGAYAHPTWSFTPRLRVWGTVGIGWSVMQLPSVKVDPPDGLVLRPRRGVFQEVPLGLGAAFDVHPRWLVASLDWMIALPYSRTGELFSNDRYYDQQGKPAEATPFPKPTSSHYLFVSLGVPF